jgi:tetratricopeptide (TPR) repeat protein
MKLMLFRLLILSLLAVPGFSAQPKDESPWQQLDSKLEILISDGKADEAFPLATNALAVAEQTWGVKHRNFAISLTKVAWLYRQRGDSAQAKDAYDRVRDLWWKQIIPEDEKTGGADNLQVADDYRRAALVFVNSGMEAHAEECYENYIAILERRLRPTDDEYLRALVRVARFYQRMDNKDRAQIYLDKYKQLSEKKAKEAANNAVEPTRAPEGARGSP